MTISDFFNAVSGKAFTDILLAEEDCVVNDKANQKIWSQFVKAVIAEVPESVIKRAKKRYGFSLDASNTCPLLVKYVLGIETALADVRSEDVDKNLSAKPIREQIPHELKSSKSVYKLSGSYQEVSIRNILLLDRLEMDRKRLQLHEKIEELSTDAFLERLAKAIISHPLEKGMLVPAPDGKGGRDYYEIVHCGGKGGLEACALAKVNEKSDLEPLLIFQPTQAGVQKQGLFTLVNDTEPDLGAFGYKASREFLENIVNDPKFSKGNLTIAGYSLGGAHAQRFLSDYPHLCNRVLFFSDPSPRDEAIAKRFADTVNAKEWKKPIKLILHRMILVDPTTNKRYEDWAVSFGKYHVGHGVINPLVDIEVRKIEYTTGKTNLRKRHVKRGLDVDPAKKHRYRYYTVPKEQIHLELDNTKRTGIMGLLETMRYRFISFFIYPVLLFFSTLCQKTMGCILRVLFKNDQQSAP